MSELLPRTSSAALHVDIHRQEQGTEATEIGNQKLEKTDRNKTVGLSTALHNKVKLILVHILC